MSSEEPLDASNKSLAQLLLLLEEHSPIVMFLLVVVDTALSDGVPSPFGDVSRSRTQ